MPTKPSRRKKEDELKNDNYDTLNRLFAEQREVLSNSIIEERSSLIAELVKQAVAEALSEQANAVTVASTNATDASTHKRKSANTTSSHEVVLCVDQNQTRIDATFREQRDAVVANKDLRNVVKEWATVSTMAELVEKIKSCGKNDLENAWLLFCWIG